MEKRVQSLPQEIQHCIVNFLIEPQPKCLLDDIRSYRSELFVVSELYCIYWDALGIESLETYIIEWFHHDLYLFCRVNSTKGTFPLFQLFMRYPQIHSKTDAYRFFVGIFEEKTILQKINLLWGLLRPEEREHFSEFLKEIIFSKIEKLT